MNTDNDTDMFATVMRELEAESSADAGEVIETVESSYKIPGQPAATNLISLPRSVQQSFLARSNQAINTLATTNSELAALLIAKQQGQGEIAYEEQDVTVTSVLRKRAWILGGDYWVDGEKTTHTRTRKLKLSE